MKLGYLAGAVAMLAMGAGLSFAADGTTPGTARVEPATLHGLGFEWPIQGDDNRNAAVTVRYRKSGEAAWRTGLPFLPLGHEYANGETRPKYVVPRMFAGSIFDLAPGTEYEVELTLKDPEGGEAVKTLKASTKPEPKMFAGGRRLHVYAKGSGGERLAPSYDDLNKAFDAAQPGDQILVHAGSHAGSCAWKKGGLPGKPIVIRGAGDGEAVLVGNKAQCMFDIHRADDLWFEDLTFRDPGTGDGGATIDGVVLLCGNAGNGVTPGCKRLVVRRCTFEDFGVGIMAADGDCEGFVITDNRFLGRQDWLGPHNPPKKGPYDKWSWTSIWISGQGHDIGYNYVRGFRDGIDITEGWTDKDFAGNKPNCAIDIYNNDITQTEDDFLETDTGVHNIRVLRNRCTNDATCGLSAQPTYGGPIYMIRNVLYNYSVSYGAARQIAFKLEVNPAGVLLYHNTVIGGQVDARYWSNCHWRNNLIMGSPGATVFHGQTHTAFTTMDHDGFGAGPMKLLWPGATGEKLESGKSLEEFAKATGLEGHGVTVDYGIFATSPELIFGKKQPCDPAKLDLRLKAGGAAVDAGCALPNVNDGFAGKAPDLGAYELGERLPHYGPRDAAQ